MPPPVCPERLPEPGNRGVSWKNKGIWFSSLADSPTGHLSGRLPPELFPKSRYLSLRFPLRDIYIRAGKTGNGALAAVEQGVSLPPVSRTVPVLAAIKGDGLMPKAEVDCAYTPINPGPYPWIHISSPVTPHFPARLEFRQGLMCSPHVTPPGGPSPRIPNPLPSFVSSITRFTPLVIHSG